MNVRLIEWLLDDYLIEAVQYGVVGVYPAPKRNHDWGWGLRKTEYLDDSMKYLSRIRARVNRALKCYKEANLGGRLWVKHSFTVVSNPKYWAPREAAAVGVTTVPAAREVVKIAMRERMGHWDAPICRNIHMSWRPQDEREKRARVTLRDMIGRKSYEDYIRKGFVSYTGKSGKHYQIFPGRAHTRVFEKGKNIGSLCAVFREYEEPNPFVEILRNTLGGMGVPVANIEVAELEDGGPRAFCPTDQLIMRLVLLMSDETHFESLCNKHPPHDPHDRQRIPLIKMDNRNLNEIYRDIRQLVA